MVGTSKRNLMSSRGGTRSGAGRKLFTPRSRFASKEKPKKKKEKKREEEMGGRKSKAIYINNDVLVSWKMKCMCLYSKDTAFARYPWRCDEERVKNPISVLDFL